MTPKVFISLLGVGFVFLAAFADRFGFGGQHPAPGFGTTQKLILVFGICIFFLGLFLPIKMVKIFAINTVVFFAALLLVDNLLYILVPYFPSHIVNWMSVTAKSRRLNESHLISSVDELEYSKDFFYLYYGKPDFGVYDEFGYRNPKQYISQQDKMDILLIGDSFTEGQSNVQYTIADNLRKNLPHYSIYSLGIHGQGIAHWELQLKRYIYSKYFRSIPKVVVFNFYSGNDIADTHMYDDMLKGKGHFRLSFFRETAAFIQNMIASLSKGKRLRINQNAQSVEKVPKLMVEPASSEKTEPGILFTPEEIVNYNDKVVFHYLEKAVKTVRQLNSEIRMILSYIPTTETCYAESPLHKNNSNVMRRWADKLGIDYLDKTAVLKNHAQNEIIHEINASDHFDDKGYGIYAGLIGEEIARIMTDEQTK